MNTIKNFYPVNWKWEERTSSTEEKVILKWWKNKYIDWENDLYEKQENISIWEYFKLKEEWILFLDEIIQIMDAHDKYTKEKVKFNKWKNVNNWVTREKSELEKLWIKVEQQVFSINDKWFNKEKRSLTKLWLENRLKNEWVDFSWLVLNDLSDESYKKLDLHLIEKLKEVTYYTSWFDFEILSNAVFKINENNIDRRKYFIEVKKILETIDWYINSTEIWKKEKTADELIVEYWIETNDLNWMKIIENFNIIRKLKDSVLVEFYKKENLYIKNEYQKFIEITLEIDSNKNNNILDYINFMKILILDLYKLKM